jgi:hypothetical protein
MKHTLLFLLLMFPAMAQETGDLRNNTKTKELEIYINEMLSIDWDTTKAGDWYYRKNTINKWCNFDSLYKANGGEFRYFLGSLDIGFIAWFKNLFNLLMEEREFKHNVNKIIPKLEGILDSLKTDKSIYERDRKDDVEIYR